MKRVAFLTLLSVFLMTGCGETTVIKDLEYIGEIQTQRDVIAQFKDENGKVLNYYWQTSEDNIKEKRPNPMIIGEKYNVEVTIGDKFTYSGNIKEVQYTE